MNDGLFVYLTDAGFSPELRHDFEARLEEENSKAVEDSMFSHPKEHDPDLYPDDIEEEEVEVRVILKKDSAYQIVESGSMAYVGLAYELLKVAIKSQVFGEGSRGEG